MKAIYQSKLYVALETDGEFPDEITLEEMDSDKRIHVPLSDPALIVDPTDYEIEALDEI